MPKPKTCNKNRKSYLVCCGSVYTIIGYDYQVVRNDGKTATLISHSPNAPQLEIIADVNELKYLQYKDNKNQ